MHKNKRNVYLVNQKQIKVENIENKSVFLQHVQCCTHICHFEKWLLKFANSISKLLNWLQLSMQVII